MSKFDISRIAKDLGKAARKHSPEILTGVGIVGMITTTVLAVRATPKALILIEDKKREIKIEAIGTDARSIELTKPEIIKATWKCYLPAAITGVCSVACLIGASSVSARRNAALAAAYALSETALNDYKTGVVKALGEKKEREVRDAIAKDKVENDPVTTKEIVITDKGETLCYESLSGRYFKSDRDQIERAVNRLNHRLLLDSYISLNEFYEAIGLETNDMGDKLEWCVDPDTADKGLIELDFSSQLATDGTPCLVVGYLNPPRYRFPY